MTHSITAQSTHTNADTSPIRFKTQAGSPKPDISKSKKSTREMIQILKEVDQDYEWYPTTEEIIECIKLDIRKINDVRDGDKITSSILDCGAGDGRVLQALTFGTKYAIEKAKPLLEQLNHQIFVVGTDFTQQTLLDKNVDIIFSNPPYLQFSAWANKIIKEANAPIGYLVLPARWVDDKNISEAIETRDAKTHVIGSFDFLEADRKARAKVDVIRVDFRRHCERFGRIGGINIDPFKLWFEESFKFNANDSQTLKSRLEDTAKNKLANELKTELVKDEGLVKVLERLYQRDLDKLVSNYITLGELDAELLDEIGVNIDGAREALKLKISSLKTLYWRELFDNLSAVTEKLTERSRTLLLDTLLAHTHVDFSAQNAHAIVIWVIKNANEYFDSQLIEVVEGLTEKANVKLYKSNLKTFGNEEWRYGSSPQELDRYQLDYRIVLERVGGLAVSDWGWDNPKCGLSKRAINFFNDLSTVAANIGFDIKSQKKADDFMWDTHVKNEFLYKNHKTGFDEVLFEAKAFKNGNLHIKFNQAFICRLNVEFGRLKGWVKSSQEAATELNIPVEIAEEYFNTNLRLENNSFPLLIAA